MTNTPDQSPSSPVDGGAAGWAVVQDGKINVATVSATRRAALVNWLVIDANCFVFAQTADEEILSMWLKYRGNADLIPVSIAPAKSTGQLQ